MSAPNIRAGVPAHPTTEDNCRDGLTIREYFAAHAPAEPQKWFYPVVSRKPERNPKWKYCAGCIEGGDCIGGADCKRMNEYKELLEAWNEEHDRQCYIQWPWAWADAVLSKSNS